MAEKAGKKAAKLPTRDQIDKRYKWNAESMYATRDDWRKELEAVKKELPKIAKLAGTLKKSGAKGLAKALNKVADTGDRVSRLYVYAGMAQAVDTLDSEAQGFTGQAAGAAAQFSAASAFMEPEILSIGKKTIDGWTAKDKDLAVYKHYFDNLFRKQKHVRSAEVEEVLGLAGEVFSMLPNTRDMFAEADMKFAPAKGGVEVAQGTIDKLMIDPDREVRRTAWQSYCDSHIALEDGLASNLVTALKGDVFYARVHQFKGSLEASLFENNVPRSVYESTIETFKKNLPVWHRYWKVRRQALKVDKLEHWDIWAPISKNPPVIPFDKAVDNICNALAPLGEKYVSRLRKGVLEDRWVDVYGTVGKTSGAFSTGCKGSFPFVKMQFTDDLSSQSTLVHELGHSMHTWFSTENQPSVYSDYSMFLAETMSNFNQAMLRAYLFDHEKDPEYQIAIIEEAMDNLHRYFFIMPTLARFELEMHERLEAGKSVTAADMNELMADLFEEGYGGQMEIDRHREGDTWAQFTHLYMNYYVYQYTTGISAAHALSAPILAGEKGAAERYIRLLSTGSSIYPIDALKKAGVDMRTPAAMEKTFEVLSGLVDRLDKLTKNR